jgi:hypothetical protein
MVTLLLSLGAPALASAAAGSGARKPEPQKAVSARSPATPAPDPAPQAQTLTSSSQTPAVASQPVGDGVAVTPVSTPTARVTEPSPSTGSEIRVPKLSATQPGARSVARGTHATTPATHHRARPRRTDLRRGAVTHKAARSHAPLALTLLTRRDLPRLPSHAPFAAGPAASPGGMSAFDAATFVLAGIVMLSPFVPVFRRALAKAAALRSGRS